MVPHANGLTVQETEAIKRAVRAPVVLAQNLSNGLDVSAQAEGAVELSHSEAKGCIFLAFFIVCPPQVLSRCCFMYLFLQYATFVNLFEPPWEMCPGERRHLQCLLAPVWVRRLMYTRSGEQSLDVSSKAMHMTSNGLARQAPCIGEYKENDVEIPLKTGMRTGWRSSIAHPFSPERSVVVSFR